MTVPTQIQTLEASITAAIRTFEAATGLTVYTIATYQHGIEAQYRAMSTVSTTIKRDDRPLRPSDEKEGDTQ